MNGDIRSLKVCILIIFFVIIAGVLMMIKSVHSQNSDAVSAYNSSDSVVFGYDKNGKKHTIERGTYPLVKMKSSDDDMWNYYIKYDGRTIKISTALLEKEYSKRGILMDTWHDESADVKANHIQIDYPRKVDKEYDGEIMFRVNEF